MMNLRERLKARRRGEPPPRVESPRWLHADSWVPPQTGTPGHGDDGRALRRAARLRRAEHIAKRPSMLASADDMHTAGWSIDHTRDRAGRLS